MPVNKIPLEQTQPGMILAQQIVRQDGVLLAQKGAVLTEPMIRMLDRMNFTSVPVETASSETPEERKARVAQDIQALKSRFSRVAQDPVLLELARAVARRIYKDS